MRLRSSLLTVATMSFTSLLSRSALSRPIGVGLFAQSMWLMSTSNRAQCNTPADPSNPLLNKDGLPLFKQIKPAHVQPALEHDLARLKTDLKDFQFSLQSHAMRTAVDHKWVTKPEPLTYSDVVEQLEKIRAPLSYSWGVVGHLMGVKNSEELRKAHSAMQPSVVQVNQEVSQSPHIFNALQKLKQDNHVWSSLDEAQQRIIDCSLRDMKLRGVALEGEAKEKFNKLQLERAELSTKFSNNLLDSTKLFKLRLTKAEDVDGLPLSAKALAAQTAVQNGDAQATAEQGPWVITLDFPSYMPCMKHLKNRAIREQLYRAYMTRASEGEHDNREIIQRTLQIKTEMAKLLGFSCYADLSLSSKMAGKVENVTQLIEMLRDKSFLPAQQELREVQEFAQQHGGFTEPLQLWDVPYWSERLREAKYEFEEEQLRPYFALPQVLKGLFGLANRLFGVEIVPVAREDFEAWHEDVMFFHVLDAQTRQHIASFYLDAYSRPAEKRGGAWMNVCVGKSRVLKRIPVAYLTCNGSPPVGDQPSLMTFREVETLFHEFGHGLQHMLTKIEHGDAAGINQIEWDAVELPSQFMENWCYDKQTLDSFARHYQTGEPLPMDLFKKLVAAKNFQAGLLMLRQLYFGAMDMYLHSKEYDPYGDKTVFEVQHDLAKKYSVMSPLPEDRFLCGFSHIFAGGYSAGYFSYKWAEVMSADAFAAFEEVGLENEAKVRETGRRFRDTVLACGGGKHPGDVYRAFRGRDPSPEALLRHSGLVGK